MGSVKDSLKESLVYVYMGGCQNHGPFLGTLSIRCHITFRTPKGTIMLTTTHVYVSCWRVFLGCRLPFGVVASGVQDLASPR